MCGIFGVISTELKKYPREQLSSFRGFQAHRGPDDTGEYADDLAYLGFNRLSIIDLSANGHQPMSDPDGRYWITFNGEIYNFEDLKKRFLSQLNLRSKTDTEVLVCLYRQFHEEMLSLLDGMFSIAIWDSQGKHLFLARDRFGEKPLWYYESDNGIAFASEIRTLLRTGVVPPEISPSGLYSFPWLGTSAFGRGIVKGVYSVQPGHFVLYSPGGMIREKPYWDLKSVQQQRVTNVADVRIRVQDLLKTSIEKRLMSDVPLGLFFSGGVDSSAIAAVTSKILGRHLNSYSIGFEEPDYDESSIARYAAAHYNLEHHAFTVDSRTVESQIQQFIKAMDCPIADGVNTYFVSMYAKEKLTVALSGIGADEIFGGYSSFRFLKLLERLDRFRFPGNKISEHVFGLLPTSLQENWFARGAVCLMGGFATEGERHELVRAYFRSTELRHLFDLDFSEQLVSSTIESSPLAILGSKTGENESSVMRQLTLNEINSYMSWLLLPAIDNFSMTFSMEVRAPFLSHELVEYVYSLPDGIKYDKHRQKPLLVDSFRQFIPPEISARKKKGFGFPLERWIFLPHFKSLFMDVLTSSEFLQRGYFSPRFVQKELDQVFCSEQKKKLPHHSLMRLWSLLMLELWLREHIDA